MRARAGSGARRAGAPFAAALALLLVGSSADDRVGATAASVREPGGAARFDPLEGALAGLRWRPLGPARFGGRVTDFAVVESKPAQFYVATASGGLWKTTSLGAHWEPVFDDVECASLGDVAIAPSDPEVVWVGTGEANNSQFSPWGNGVYRSTDGARTWTHLGLEETRHIGRIVVDPTDPDLAYVAAVGHLWGPNAERGVFRTLDGGQSWKKVLFIDADTGVIDLVMDPGDPRVLFAAAYQRRRMPWGFSRSGPGSGIYRTTDGGATWTKLTAGLPEGNMGRIGLDIHRRDGSTVFAAIEATPPAGGLYRSADGGDTWEQLSDLSPWPVSSYFGQIRIDPNDPQRIYVGGRPLSVSDDGGRTFRDTGARGVHSDHHALWIDPNDSDYLLLGNDGGVYVSFDRGEHWRMLDNLPLGQFYAIGVDMQEPYWVCGGLQDNGGWCGPSAARYGGGIGNYDWVNIVGADGFYVAVDPEDPRVLFTEWQVGRMVRVDRVTGERKPIQPQADPGEPPYRWNFSTPIVMSTHDPKTLYVGANVVLRTTDRGATWTAISPDLSRSQGRPPPGVATEPNDRTLGRYGTITTIAESALDPQLLYAGTDDGSLHVTRDGGRTWKEVSANVPGLPPGTYVSRVVASRARDTTVYATFDGHYRDDYRAYVYMSDDYGTSWKAIDLGLPEWSVNVLVEHPANPDVLVLGNEVGVYVSIDRGERWMRLKNNLPTVPVDDIVVHPRENDLVLGTHGRSIWVLDDMTPLEQLTWDVLQAPAHLFPIRRATIFNYPPTPLSHRRGIDAGPRYWNSGTYAAPNPPAGALIRYHLRDTQPAPVQVTMLGADGRILRELEGPRAAGFQELVWDLRLQPHSNGAPAPRVGPGEYTVRLEAAGQVFSDEVSVRLDPLVEASQEELRARQQLLMAVHALGHSLVAAAAATDRLLEELSVESWLRQGDAQIPAEIVQAAHELEAEIREIDAALDGQLGRRLRLFSGLDQSHLPPRPAEFLELDRIREEARGTIERLGDLIRTRLADLVPQLASHGVRIAPPPPPAIPPRTRG